MNLQLKKIGAPAHEMQGENNALIAVEMLVSATNPSAREVYLLPSVWMAYGYKVKSLHDEANFIKDVNDKLSSDDIVFVEKHASHDQLSAVAIGRLFIDDSLKPSETVTREIVFHVPPNQYDVIIVRASIPNTSWKNSVIVDWSFEGQQLALVPTMYFVNNKGERKEIEKDKDGSYSSANFDLQTAQSSASLSLW